jgi:hypothetical protein
VETTKGEIYIYPTMHYSFRVILKLLFGLIFILGTIADALVLVKEHQVEAIGCATVAGFILFRGIRLVFIWNLIAICLLCSCIWFVNYRIIPKGKTSDR